MSISTEDATNWMLAEAKKALAALPEVVVQFELDDPKDPPSQTSDWALVDVKHEDGGQTTLCGPINGATRWGQTGVISAQCFAVQAKGGRKKAMQMACAVRDAFRGRATVSGIWFRRHTIREVGRDKAWYQVNAFIFFTYDEVKSHVP